MGNETKPSIFDLMRKAIDEAEALSEDLCSKLPSEARGGVETSIAIGVINRLHQGISKGPKNG